jgi:hypothetical protein
MEPKNSSKNTTSVSVMIGVLALLTVAIPFSSSIKKEYSGRPPLILRTESELALLWGDKNKNQNPDWRDLLLETVGASTPKRTSLSSIDELATKRLNDPDNLTASFSKNIYIASAYSAKNKSSNSDQAKLISNLIQQEGERIVPKTYTLKDLLIVKDDSLVNKKTYGNALGVVFKKAESYGIENGDEISIVNEFMSKKDAKTLQTVVIKKENLEKIFSLLLETEVPPSAAPYHLFLVNKTSNYITTLDSFSKLDTDPMRGLASLNSYEKTSKQLVGAIKSLKQYFSLEGVSFTKNESGYILFGEN